MNDPLSKLPTVVLLGVLVAIFAALLKQNRTFRFRLWFLGWAIIFVRFVLQMIWKPLGLPTGIYAAIDLSSLQIAGIIFMGSVSALAETKRRNLYFLYFGVPITMYAFCLTNGVESFWAYLGILLFMGVMPTISLLREAGATPWNFTMLGSAWATLIWSLWKAYYGRPELGF